MSGEVEQARPGPLDLVDDNGGWKGELSEAAEWARDDVANPQPTFTFVRRAGDVAQQQQQQQQPSGPPTPSEVPDDSDADEERNDTPTTNSPRAHPRFSRAFSLPQLGRLQNPHRPSLSQLRTSGVSDPGTPTSYQFFELSLELADMVQMAIQTLLQISPPQVLDSTKEQFSACALSVPTPSVNALFTAMRNLNYFSANIPAFCEEPPEAPAWGAPPLILPTEFDLGELLQSVGDVMSGAAAQAGIDLVLYHGDLSLKYAWVRGSESGLTVTLSHILRQIISVSHPGDAIEVGLFIGFAPAPGQEILISDDLEPVPDAITSSPVSEEGPIHCTIQIAHKHRASYDGIRKDPHFSSLILRRLLRLIGGQLSHDLPSSTNVRTCELSLTMERASRGGSSPSRSENSAGKEEPTLEELTAFAETLKGAKVALHSSSKGSFAQHVTRYLADWGMDVSHIPTDGEAETEVVGGSPRAAAAVPAFTSDAPGPAPAKVEVPTRSQRLSFVFIDDDVVVLKDRLESLRRDTPYPLTLKRPPLAQHTRRSTSQVPRLSNPLPASSVVIVHFTSLANFKVVKDVLQSVLSTFLGTSTPIPEVMIVPKPAGPQRVLTQLHMAVTRPPVDPFFLPIATSPSSPSPSFMSYASARSPASGLRPPSARSNSDRSTRSGTKEGLTSAPPPPSPLAISHTGSEYFGEDAAAVQLGATASSGLLIQSPGAAAPSGIYFSPRTKSVSKRPQPPVVPALMERDRGQLTLPSASRRSSLSRVVSDNPTFSSLHEVAHSIEPPVLPPVATAAAAPVVVKPDAELSPTSPSSSTSPTSFRRPVRRRTVTPDPKTLEKASAPLMDIVPPINVLIVEDNVVNQMQLQGFMRKKKLKCQVAKNGLEAIEKWKNGNFDLILMDIQMPVMGGIEATKEIRRLEKLNAAEGYPPADGSSTSGASPYRSSVIIVAQTASSLNSDRVKALAAGCNDFLTKPVNHHWLNNKVTEWGSIKALQMWADVAPPAGSETGPVMIAAKAQQVAERLHVPAKPNGKRREVVSLPSSDKPPPSASQTPPTTATTTTPDTQTPPTTTESPPESTSAADSESPPPAKSLAASQLPATPVPR
ncbi:unnamed protein product [Mycena citricolor]|uniref:Response regulatory domain-containing protein n=1 Tax=Mycena citricolor TaxID=2018698 RepID=A0AAD2HJP5_9AGAR|nr:unnamed protein product [Mycena citricolor]